VAEPRALTEADAKPGRPCAAIEVRDCRRWFQAHCASRSRCAPLQRRADGGVERGRRHPTFLSPRSRSRALQARFVVPEAAQFRGSVVTCPPLAHPLL
jgi:hypothetical protein